MKKLIALTGCFVFFLAPAYGENIKLVRSESRTPSKAVNRSLQNSSVKKAVLISNSEVQVYDLKVPPPGNISEFIRCSFTVRNNTNQQAVAGKYKFFINKRKQGGNWEPVSSGFLPAIGAKQVISHTEPVKLSIMIKEVQIAIHEDNDSTKPFITQVTGATKMPPASAVQIEDIYTDINNWRVTIRNNSQYNLWYIAVQTSVSNGGNWQGSGGASIVNIPPGATGQAIMPRPAGWKNGYTDFKIDVYQLPDLITQRTISFE